MDVGRWRNVWGLLMRDLDWIGRRHAEVVRSSFDDIEPPPLESLSRTRRRAPRASLVALAGAAAVVAALLPAVFLGGSDEPSRTTMPTTSFEETAEGTQFVPPSVPEGDSVAFPMVLLDGSKIRLNLPSSLADDVAGFVPGGAAGWDDGLCCSRSLTFFYGSVEDVVGDRATDAVYEDAAGHPVHFYEALDLGGRSDLDYLVFQFGSWVVMAWDDGSGGGQFSEESRARFASLMDGYETPEGFLVLDPVDPMTVRPTDSPDAVLTNRDGNSMVGLIRRDCSVDAARATGATSLGYFVTVDPESGLTSLCSPGQSIVVWVGRTDLSEAELDEVQIGGSATLRPFDFNRFLESKLAGVFVDSEQAVGVVVLAPARSEVDVEELLTEANLPGLEGFSHVPSDVLASVADRFAAAEGMAPLTGNWVGYGLIPRFDDSPTAEWVSTLSNVPNIRVAPVEFDTPTVEIPEGWTEVADLPIQLESGAIVEAVGNEVVVLQSSSTMVIDPDGSYRTGDAPPVSIPTHCCGKVRGLPADDVLVVGSWILDPETLDWHQTDPRPTSGSALGSAFLEGEVYVVSAAARTGEPTSTLAAFDTDTGVWRELEPVPSPISVGGVTTDGERLIVAGTRQDDRNFVIGDRNPVAYQYTPGEGWRELPSIPIDGQASTVTWAEGAGLLAWNYDLQSAVLDDSGTWRQIGEVPMPPSECYPISHSTTTGAIGQCGGVALFDARSESWEPITGPLDTKYAVPDTAVIGLVPLDGFHTKLIAHPLP